MTINLNKPLPLLPDELLSWDISAFPSNRPMSRPASSFAGQDVDSGYAVWSEEDSLSSFTDKHQHDLYREEGSSRREHNRKGQTHPTQEINDPILSNDRSATLLSRQVQRNRGTTVASTKEHFSVELRNSYELFTPSAKCKPPVGHQSRSPDLPFCTTGTKAWKQRYSLVSDFFRYPGMSGQRHYRTLGLPARPPRPSDSECPPIMSPQDIACQGAVDTNRPALPTRPKHRILCGLSKFEIDDPRLPCIGGHPSHRSTNSIMIKDLRSPRSRSSLDADESPSSVSRNSHLSSVAIPSGKKYQGLCYTRSENSFLDDDVDIHIGYKPLTAKRSIPCLHEGDDGQQPIKDNIKQLKAHKLVDVPEDRQLHSFFDHDDEDKQGKGFTRFLKSGTSSHLSIGSGPIRYKEKPLSVSNSTTDDAENRLGKEQIHFDSDSPRQVIVGDDMRARTTAEHSDVTKTRGRMYQHSCQTSPNLNNNVVKEISQSRPGANMNRILHNTPSSSNMKSLRDCEKIVVSPSMPLLINDTNNAALPWHSARASASSPFVRRVRSTEQGGLQFSSTNKMATASAASPLPPLPRRSSRRPKPVPIIPPRPPPPSPSLPAPVQQAVPETSQHMREIVFGDDSIKHYINENGEMFL